MWFGTNNSILKFVDQIAEVEQYELAFSMYSFCSEYYFTEQNDRAYCKARMGDLAAPCPYLMGSHHDSGIDYFREAISIDIDCGDAWLGALVTYGIQPPAHTDAMLAASAADRIQQYLTHTPHGYRERAERALKNYLNC